MFIYVLPLFLTIFQGCCVEREMFEHCVSSHVEPYTTQVVSWNSAVCGQNIFYLRTPQNVLLGNPDPYHCRQGLILYL